MIIHITDLKQYKIVEPMTLFVVSFLKGGCYNGVIPTFNNQIRKNVKYRPLWIYKKCKHINQSQINKYIKLFQSKYKSIYDKCYNIFSK